MATVIQIGNLRRRLQDFYDKDGNLLVSTDHAFADDELNVLIDDGFAEATDGARTALTLNAVDLPLAMMLARADGLLQLAQDESRRLKWEVNNKIIDNTDAAKRLIEIARELRQRYNAHRDRLLKKELSDKVERPTGGVLRLNDSVDLHLNRDFNNRDVSRNKPRR